MKASIKFLSTCIKLNTDAASTVPSLIGGDGADQTNCRPASKLAAQLGLRAECRRRASSWSDREARYASTGYISRKHASFQSALLGIEPSVARTA